MFNYKNEVVLQAKSADERTRVGADLIQIPHYNNSSEALLEVCQ